VFKDITDNAFNLYVANMTEILRELRKSNPDPQVLLKHYTELDAGRRRLKRLLMESKRQLAGFKTIVWMSLEFTTK
jgi:hypothetical protein